MFERRAILTLGILGVLAFGAATALGSATAADRDGKAVFLEFKCNTCHTMDAQGIAKRKAAAGEEAQDKEKKSEKKPPDLSGVGLQRKADWIAKYLMKKEAIDGEKHTKRFKGTEPDLQLVSTWLEAQKTKPKKK